MGAAKKLVAMEASRKLAKLLEKSAKAEKLSKQVKVTVKATPAKSKAKESKSKEKLAALKAKGSKRPTIVSLFPVKEAEKLRRFGIEARAVVDPTIEGGENAGEIILGNVTFSIGDREEAQAMALAIYEHVKKHVEAIVKAHEEEGDE